DAQRHAELIARLAGPPFGLQTAHAILQTLVGRRDKLLRELAVPAKQQTVAARAVERFVCAEHLAAEGRPADDVDLLLDAALAEDVPLGPAHALRALSRLRRA